MVAACALVLHAARQRGYLAVGWFWFVGTLVPVIGLVQVGEQAMADRYTYIPLIGIFLAGVWGAADLAQRWRLPPRLVGACGCAALVALAVAARLQTGHWRDSLALWQHAIEVAAPSAVAYNSLGVALGERGRPLDAVECFRQALELDPRDLESRMNLASTLYALGQINEAKREYEAALAVNPSSAVAHHNLGVLLWRAGKVDEAVAHYEAALHADPDYWRAHLSLSMVLVKAGDAERAQRHFQEAVRGNPRLIEELPGRGASAQSAAAGATRP